MSTGPSPSNTDVADSTSRPLTASLWVFDWMDATGSDDSDHLAEAAPTTIRVIRNDEEHILISAHFADDNPEEDMVWLELDLSSATQMMARIGYALTVPADLHDSPKLWRCGHGQWKLSDQQPRAHRHEGELCRWERWTAVPSS